MTEKKKEVVSMQISESRTRGKWRGGISGREQGYKEMLKQTPAISALH